MKSGRSEQQSKNCKNILNRKFLKIRSIFEKERVDPSKILQKIDNSKKLSFSWLIVRYHGHENIGNGFAKNTRVPNSKLSIMRFTQTFLMDAMTTAVELYEGTR